MIERRSYIGEGMKTILDIKRATLVTFWIVSRGFQIGRWEVVVVNSTSTCAVLVLVD
ncbi:hypothetical protein HanIR_Chr03g0137951 [Helianthus annuus]|nr:hypothetical protein HanIR_Chr03g0137951 [Helianthus annuus]